ncbi:ribonucleoside-diphosphate reductase subunit alpha [Tengunoibacter tsumagoiensis]|uniref:Ribonucleoside-diphosphate reductase n=1 Tax=Tengunoibacter tsumagoiensis TaxID=2014871 RepID=A0A401ZUS7_9CHLR|nr:ribonucleoside-diphosphate reductase subunit alpha [Tengunoibacter tsumagoiensis]GCE10552.1 ribonucleoside-diphosphate reductase subunit alpha [Tengunoibacter tsumagoiensis]
MAHSADILIHTIPAENRQKPALSIQDIQAILQDACRDLTDIPQLMAEVQSTITIELASRAEIWQAMIMVARTYIEREPEYTYVAARLLLLSLYDEIALDQPQSLKLQDAPDLYRRYFATYLQQGIQGGLLDPRLLEFDLDLLSSALQSENDLLFAYPGLQTLYDRYLIQIKGRRIELPQLLWMRVAMGLALNEQKREQRALEFYRCIANFFFTPATPTLFNAGTCHPQLSSCYLTTIQDDLKQIFKSYQDNALLSKWAGGLGNDWTYVRASGAHIKGTNGISQGIIPFLKVANDTAIAVNQGGKRKGAVCAYLENWHLDIEEFLDLRRNTGDERRRTHDMHTACWISDEFMQRVQNDEQWTLFSPDEVPELHDAYGQRFSKLYRNYERLADEGQITLFRRLPALELWRKMLTRLFETGHPWLTWKDPANVRSPQDHVGVIHSSNLCTEILLNTAEDETAVCNLGSLNLVAHLRNGRLDEEQLEQTIGTAMRMLDNVVDINYYPTLEAKNANLRHRAVGLGLMGFQDALSLQGISYASQEAIEFADRSMECISYYAILASTALAAERGCYSSYKGSKWQRGILPCDSIALVASERGAEIAMDRSIGRNWQPVRDAIQRYGMRNSNVMAIAPTATISTIVGVSQSIEPAYKNLYVRSNLSGEFTILNTFLVQDLKAVGLWGLEMLEALKYYDGSLQELTMIPIEIRRRYLTAAEIEPEWLIECASRRQKWIDMGQSLNLYLVEPSGKKLHDIYLLAWQKGLKTTYYLRTMAATQIEKSTVDINRWGIQPRWMKNSSASSAIQIERERPLTCALDEDCEACQ